MKTENEAQTLFSMEGGGAPFVAVCFIWILKANHDILLERKFELLSEPHGKIPIFIGCPTKLILSWFVY